MVPHSYSLMPPQIPAGGNPKEKRKKRGKIGKKSQTYPIQEREDPREEKATLGWIWDGTSIPYKPQKGFSQLPGAGNSSPGLLHPWIFGVRGLRDGGESQNSGFSVPVPVPGLGWVGSGLVRGRALKEMG